MLSTMLPAVNIEILLTVTVLAGMGQGTLVVTVALLTTEAASE